MNELRWETTPALEHGKRMIYGDYSCIDAIAFSPFHYLESRFFRRSYLSYSFFFFFHDHVVPCIFLSGPWKSLSLSLSLPLSLSTPLLLSSSYSQPGKFIFSRVEAFSISFSKACRKGSSVVILGPFAFASPTSELYTQYIMNIAISRRSYTVRSFLKWKTARKVGRGLKVTLLLLDSPTLESSYRLSSSRVPLGQHSQL